MLLNWKYIKTPLKVEDITKIETTFHIQLPITYKKILCKYHGGRPDKKMFKPIIGKERTLKSFLPISSDYKVNLFNVKEWLGLPDDVIPFANLPSGDYLCLDYRNSADPNVVLLHHEIDAFELVSNTFDQFISSLY
ncbi:SMI1/KNR4 family protein [Bacillus sp. JJ1474]|uniref:SMI1/KNR4 family protein n=1 Tax=Bacillus sp. JJ1474 TaxID=3122955 RepID=UPI002FFFFDC5